MSKQPEIALTIPNSYDLHAELFDEWKERLAKVGLVAHRMPADRATDELSARPLRRPSEQLLRKVGGLVVPFRERRHGLPFPLSDQTLSSIDLADKAGLPIFMEERRRIDGFSRSYYSDRSAGEINRSATLFTVDTRRGLGEITSNLIER